MKKWFKIVDITENNEVKTLFHGLNGSRILPTNKWLTATKKIVSDGKGTKYLSGFHIMESFEEAQEYLKRFKNISSKGIIEVSVKNMWKKEHSTSNVWLSEKIKINDIIFQYSPPEVKGVGDLLTHYFGISPGFYILIQ